MKFFDNIQPMRRIYTNPLSFLWESLCGARKWAFVGVFLALGLQVAKVLVSVIFAKMVDYFSEIVPADFDWRKAGLLLAGVFCAYVFQSVFRMIREVLEENRVRNYIDAKIKLFGVGYLANHSEGYFGGQKTGDLSQKVVRCAKAARDVHMLISRMYSNIFLALINFCCVGFVSVWFLPLFVFFGVFSFYFSYRTSFAMRDLNKDVEDSFDEYNGILADSIGNALTVKSFGSEEYELSFVRRQYQKVRDARLFFLDRAYTLRRIQEMGVVGFEICSLLLLIWLWYGQKISVGDVTFVLLVQGTIVSCIIRMMGDTFDLNAALGSLKAAMMPFVEKHEIVDIKGAKKLRVKTGGIEFKKVKFSYGGKPVFRNLSLKINGGEKVGIVGVSGSGKSTLINLLRRAYNIQSGQILIDGQNISLVQQSSLHKAIALIPQDTSLFHRTISQNIAYGKQASRLSEIKKAAIKACADEFIANFPKGYQTKVGEKGVKLSGGQRQRIAIARAVLKNSPILILDEATSALDSETESDIQKAMKNLMKDKTVLAVSHRLSTLKEMDRIIVLGNGKIIEQGTIQELLARKGVFYKLWCAQH